MKLHSTVVFVKNIEISKDFYTRFLGFSIEHDFGKNIILNSGIALWEIQPEHVICKQLVTNNQSNRFELYLESAEIEKALKMLEESGVEFLHKIHEESWGQRTLRFFDPDNHLIEIGEPLEVFVNNMHGKGMTPAQISTKSGVPIQTLLDLIQN